MQVYGASLKDPAHACLVMELVKGGNLHQRIYDCSAPRLTHLEILQASYYSILNQINSASLCCPLGILSLKLEVESNQTLLHTGGKVPRGQSQHRQYMFEDLCCRA